MEKVNIVLVKKNSEGKNKYYVNNIEKGDIILDPEVKNYITLSVTNNSNHPFAISDIEDGGWTATDDDIINLQEVLALTKVETENNNEIKYLVDLDKLDTSKSYYYFCLRHSGMGGTIKFKEQEETTDVANNATNDNATTDNAITSRGFRNRSRYINRYRY